MDQGVYDLSRNSAFAAFAFIGYKERAAAIDDIAFVLPPEIIPVALVFPEFDYLDALVRRYDPAEAVPEPARTPSQGQIEQQRERLRTHRGNLAHYLTQVARLGLANAPISLVNGIKEERRAVRAVKQTLRGWGVAVDDESDDEDRNQL